MTLRKNNTFYGINKNKNTKKAYTERSKSMGRKIGFVVVLTYITKRWILLEEDSIHSAEITAIKVALMEIRKKKKRQNWVIYKFSELHAVHGIQ